MRNIVILKDFEYCVWIMNEDGSGFIWNSVTKTLSQVAFAEELKTHPKKILIKYED